jgi:hypothetical protein
MPNKVQRYRITGTISAAGAFTATTNQPLHGRIKSIAINYPAATVALVLSSGDLVSQTILTLGAANTDITYYPRTPVCVNTGAETILYSTGNKVCTEYVVNSVLTLTASSGTAGQIVTMDVLVEEW